MPLVWINQTSNVTINIFSCDILEGIIFIHLFVFTYLSIYLERQTSVYRKPTYTGLYLNWHSFAPKSRKLNLIRCLSYRALNICSEYKIENKLRDIRDIFIDNGYSGDVIDSNIKYMVTKFRDTNKVFGPLKCPVYFRLPWGGFATESITNKIASSVFHCYNAVKLRPIFTSRPAFNSTNKYKLPIFKRSNLIYKFTCRCNSTYRGMTCQRLEVRVRQHISQISFVRPINIRAFPSNGFGNWWVSAHYK